LNHALILSDIQRGLAGLMCVRQQCGQDIDHGVDDATVAGVLDLLDVFELIVDVFDNGTFALQELVGQRHQCIVHVLADFGDQTQPPCR